MRSVSPRPPGRVRTAGQPPPSPLDSQARIRDSSRGSGAGMDLAASHSQPRSIGDLPANAPERPSLAVSNARSARARTAADLGALRGGHSRSLRHADPWPGRRPDGGMSVRRVLVVLTDDAGHRALPIRLSGRDGGFWRLLAGPEDRDEVVPEDRAEEMTGQLLDAAGITVTAVTVTEMGPAVTATR